MEIWAAFLIFAIVFAAVGFLRLKPWPSPKKGDFESPGAMRVINRTGPPDVFDPERISKDLQGFLDQPTLFHQYIHRLRNRATKSGEIDFIQHWVEYYNAAHDLIDSKTGLERAATTYKQLGYEDEIKRMQKDAEIAKLKADQAEHQLRADRALFKSQNVKEFIREDSGGSGGIAESQSKHEDETKLNAALHKRKHDIRWKIEQLGEGVTTLVELQKWRKRQIKLILEDKGLTATEQTQAVQEVNDHYDRELKNMKQDTDIFEER